MKAAVVGSGSMGTALACLLSENGWTVTCWDHVPQVVEDIRKNHKNDRYLPGLGLPMTIQAELLIDRVVQDATILFINVPSPYFRHVAAECAPFLRPDTVVVNAAKGLELHTSKRLSKVFEEVAPSNSDRYTVLAGPSVAVEFARKKPTAVVAASASESAQKKVAQALNNAYFRVETTDDMAGAEWGGVLKNVYAIGLGLLDGLEAGGANVKAAFTSAAFREMKRLSVVLGAREKTIDGPAGLGDLVATGFSADSHNRRLGELLGRGRPFEDAIDALGGGVPEGVRSASRTLELAAQHKTEVPVASAIEACLKNPAECRSKFLANVWKAF